MFIRFEGLRENNLKGIDLELGDGVTAVTGVSGSGKSSFVFDTLYRESRRRFLEAFGTGPLSGGIPPATAASVKGMYPSVALSQNSENRNPASTVATATGIHPFLRILWARFGERKCPGCGERIRVHTKDGISRALERLAVSAGFELYAPLVRKGPGSHETLLRMLLEEAGGYGIALDGRPLTADARPDPSALHDIDLLIGTCPPGSAFADIARAVSEGFAWGVPYLLVRTDGNDFRYARDPVCTRCGMRLFPLEPKHFNDKCPSCGGAGCTPCGGTGLYPQAASVYVSDLNLPSFLSLACGEARSVMGSWRLPGAADRLLAEIGNRLDAVAKCGLGYASLDRPVPSLSRGEAQRLRLAVVLRSPLDDMLHILDEPTIGLHRADTARFLPVLDELPGPVVFVEHDAGAVAAADRVLEFGPGAGGEGGRIVFDGTPGELWKADTASGRYFSGRGEPGSRIDPAPGTVKSTGFTGAFARNLKGIDVEILSGRLNVICGVSGSGKSTLVEEVMAASIERGVPTGCRSYSGSVSGVVFVDQSPIGRNPRSNPATYTKLAEAVRDLFSERSGLPASSFSFNRPEGACPECGGMGATEVRMKFLAPTWIPCEACGGGRFREEVAGREIPIGGTCIDIASFLSLSAGEAYRLVESDTDLAERRKRPLARTLGALVDIGLGYLRLDQPSTTLSGGEAQRVKLAKFLGAASGSGRLFVLDEPTSGLHPADVAGLIRVFRRLCREGATVVAVEHDPDVIRAADRVIELGPGSGPEGGFLLYQGTVDGLLAHGRTPTAECLSVAVSPAGAGRAGKPRSDSIRIRGARANNLRGIDLDLDRGKLHVVTGISGSGKSSLIRDVLEAEARARYLESISSFERQNARDREHGAADSIEGLPLAVSVCSEKFPFGRRATVGTVTGLSGSVAVLLSVSGRLDCPVCGNPSGRAGNQFVCPACGAGREAPDPALFLPSTYGAACTVCHGIGTLQKPCPEKLIIAPERPLLAGAMYSPGFFPNGYLGRPGNGGYDQVMAFAARYGFDPFETPWNEIPEPVKNAFLFGDPEPMEVTFTSPSGRTTVRTAVFPGFYGWIGEWDTGGTYTARVHCPSCGGARLRKELLAFTLSGRNAHELESMPLDRLGSLLESEVGAGAASETAKRAALVRIGFLRRVGLGYLSLSREASTLSAGEAQRVRLSGLLGSELSGITVILDEPTKGMHPSEVDGLVACLATLRNEGNTVIVSEHDPSVILAADRVWDLGPGAGRDGGALAASGSPPEIIAAGTTTGRTLSAFLSRGRSGPEPGARVSGSDRGRRTPQRWMTLRGAKGNNLNIPELKIPLGVLCGVLGVSGSGKSTLVIDTIGRILAPRTHTTSVAREPLEPEPYESLDGRPGKTLIVDQSGIGDTSPAAFLGVEKRLRDLYARRAEELGLPPEETIRTCGACGGSGETRIDLGFLQAVRETCEVCDGTGYTGESRAVTLGGVTIGEALGMTLDGLREYFGADGRLGPVLEAAASCRLGYLVAKQHGRNLSSGEKRRLKTAQALARGSSSDELFLFDEPTAGLHLDDIDALVRVLDALVDSGKSCIVVEHSMSLLARCDRLIELGPGGGWAGGRVVFSGTPEELASAGTPSSRYLREVLP